MIIDLKFNGKNIFIIHDTYTEKIEPLEPYFYIIYPKNTNIELLKRCTTGKIIDIEETGFLPLIEVRPNKFDIDSNYKVAKVYCRSPSDVPEIAHRFLQNKFKCSAFNVKYLARVSFDLDLKFFNIEPLYYGLDSDVIEKIRKLKVLVIDVEAINFRPVLCSVYTYTPFDEVRIDDIQHLKLPDEYDTLQKIIDHNYVIVGHNILGFDIPILKKDGVTIDQYSKCFVDISAILANWSQSFQIGSARSLLDVSKALKEKANITDEEIEIKERARGKIDKMSWDELVRYNVNDVVLTSKLLNIFLTFLVIVSGLTQIPVSVVQSTTAGTIAEYFLLHDMELKGIVPEYRSVDWRVSAEKVYIYAQNYVTGKIHKYDVKMMYPSYVLKHFIDPTLTESDGNVQEGVTYKIEHKVDEKIRFNLNSGLGIIYSTIKKLINLRMLTKSLKKSNPLYENVDLTIKAILNALAYGVQGKKSGYAILGNVACPVKIFLGTTRILYEVIEKLKERGYKVVYGDTDSLFIEHKDVDPQELLKIINDILRPYGLEVDYEGSYDQGYIISKKSYVLIGNDVVLKGGKIKMKLKFFLPQIISKNFIKIVKNYPYNYKKIVRELIDSCNIEELFSTPAQQIWRLIGKDPTAVKREIKQGKEVVVVRTVWDTVRILYLKKGNPATFAMPSHAPLITLLANSTDHTLMLYDYEPFYIIDSMCMYIPSYVNVKLNIPVWRHYNVKCLYYIDNKIYAIGVKSIRYILEDKYGSVEKIESNKINSTYNYYKIVGVEGQLEIYRVNINEQTLREIAYRISIEQIKRIFETELD